MLILNLYLLTVAISICAWVYTTILTDSGMILFKYQEFLFKRLNPRCSWLFKMIVGCSHCVSGQMALWIYLYMSLFQTQFFDILHWDIVTHIWFVSVTIFNVALIKKTGLYDS